MSTVSTKATGDVVGGLACLAEAQAIGAELARSLRGERYSVFDVRQYVCTVLSEPKITGFFVASRNPCHFDTYFHVGSWPYKTRDHRGLY